HTGLAHCPSGRFFANAVWMAAAVIAHNLYRWINHHTGQGSPQRLTNGNTVRNRLFHLPGRIVNHAGQLILRLPARWPWSTAYHTTLTGIRNLPQLC
ncbi:MAG: transposase, partial [Acidimicrobiia bacterium]|nr:transposase [Acidimicrobiia bacterium]